MAKSRGSYFSRSLLRVFVGYFFLMFIAVMAGFFISSWEMGLVLGLWFFPIGPVFFYVFFRWGLKSFLNLEPFDWERDPVLSKEYFKLLLQKPGPRPEFYVRPGEDKGFFWLGKAMGFSSRQIAVVSRGWTQQSLMARVRGFHGIWEAMVRDLDTKNSRLHSVQVVAWAVVVAPLEVLVQFTQLVMDLFGFEKLPSLAFWIQIPLKKLYSIWIDKSSSSFEAKNSQFEARPLQNTPSLPWGWNSLIWGPWVRAHRAESHPLWEAFYKPDCFYGNR